MRLCPGQEFRWSHLVVDGVRRILAAVAVVDHHGREDTARPCIDRYVLAWRARTRGPPEVCEVIRVGHAFEDDLARSVEHPGEPELVFRRLHESEPLRPRGPDPRSRRWTSNLSKRSFQIRRCVLIQSSVWSSAPTSRWHGRNWASRRREISPLRSSTLRCFEMPGSDMAKGAASSLTVASPCASRLTMARRVGSASAANAASSLSSVIWAGISVFNL